LDWGNVADPQIRLVALRAAGWKPWYPCLANWARSQWVISPDNFRFPGHGPTFLFHTHTIMLPVT
jgi:hypothetical protein